MPAIKSKFASTRVSRHHPEVRLKSWRGAFAHCAVFALAYVCEYVRSVDF
jgi:hypothetical protein